jgi:hypothetical protein
MADVERANNLFGGTRAALKELEPAIGEAAKMRDVARRGDWNRGHTRSLQTSRAKRGVTLRTIGFDLSPVLRRAVSPSK